MLPALSESYTSVQNLSSSHFQLARGLIAITGETGAGKSLISSAFSLAAGTRVRGSELVGSKGPTARVQLDLMLGDEHMRSTREVERHESFLEIWEFTGDVIAYPCICC